jgi:hypothetical protein
MYIPTTNFEGIYLDTLKFTLRKTWKSLSVCCKKFHFQENFCRFGEIKIIKKEENRPWHSKQAANMLFCTSRGTQVALARKGVGRRPSA